MQLEQSLQEASYPLRHDIDLHLTVMAVRRLPFIANLSEVDRAMLSTVVSELGSNILKYAERGEITLTLHHPSGRPCIDIVARDQGPGIGDVHQAMQDHYSTSGTLGLGLPGVRRMMSELTISTPPEGGTLVQARKWLGAAPLVSRPTPSPVPASCTPACNWHGPARTAPAIRNGSPVIWPSSGRGRRGYR